MRSYETTFILAPTLDAEGVTAAVNAVKNVITSKGGEITAEKDWGRRRLAYPIRDFSEGAYWILRFTLADRTGLDELARHFRLSEIVLRNLVIRDEGTPLEYASLPSEFEDQPEGRDRPGYRRGGPPRESGRGRRFEQESDDDEPAGARERSRG
ncbi:MAG: 30S ribosomal protein S6 [Candidatus Eiseniibacteriota bacterium]